MKKFLLIIIAMLLLASLLSMCGTDTYDAHDLQAAKERYYSGHYTREDEIMVEGFNKWKANQNKYID